MRMVGSMSPIAELTNPAQPAKIIAGDTARWLETAPNNRPENGWTLNVVLVNATQQITTTSTDAGDSRHLIEFAAADTAALAEGKYSLVIAAEKGTDRLTLSNNPITVQPNLFDGFGDGRSHVQKTLDAIESWIENRDPGVAEYQINGHGMKYWSMEELLKLQSTYRARLHQETNRARISQGKRPRGRRILMRF